MTGAGAGGGGGVLACSSGPNDVIHLSYLFQTPELENIENRELHF